MMTPERWQQVKGVLQEALELAPEQRLAFLDRACSNDRSLRREVESLILVNEQIGTRFPSACPILDEALFRLLPGKRIGPYEILEEVAHGGMGVVYRAVRVDGEYKQQVAVKIVRADLDAELTATRFRNERQILASLDHPNIAKILDGGTTADGIPYFVMEFVHGLPITDYCDRHKLSIDSRLEIFRTVCASVHYAHQHLVIHRDLKPSNILITAEGIPKLLDFGIAKILDPSLLPENTTMTAGGLWLMTPEYASPEQLSGEVITTSTDIYSLGLILYQLLTGHHAYRFASRLPHEITRVIFESEPENPSAAVRLAGPSEGENPGKVDLTPEVLSSSRGTSPERLRRRLAGDLDNIALKAIRKEPRDRYNSVEQLAEDIRRHLEGLPVTARKATVSYRFRKYALRHKVGLAAAALVFLSLLTGMALTVREARIAERRFNDVRALANSLLFDLHDAIQDLPGSTPARKLLVERALQYLDSLSSDASTDTGLARELATAYERVGELQGQPLSSNVGETSNSITSHQKALAIRRRLGERPNAEWQDRLSLAESYRRMATELISVGNTETALGDAQNAASIAESLSNARPNDVHVLYELGADYEVLGNIQGNTWGYAGLRNLAIALENYNRALETQTRILSIEPNTLAARRAWTLDALRIGNIQMDLGHAAEALATFHEALEVSLSLSHASGAAQDLRRVAVIYNQLAMLYDRTSERRLCLDNHEKGLEIYKQLVSQDPKNALFRHGVAIAYANVGDAESKLGHFSQGVADIKRAVAIMNALVEGDPNSEQRDILAQIHVSLGDVFARAVKFSEAIREYRTALGIYEAMLSSGNNAGMITGIATCKVRIAEAERRSGNLMAAIADFQKALTLSTPRLDSNDDDTRRNTAKAYAGLADIEWEKASEITSQGRQRHGEQAIQWYRRSLEVGKQVPPLAPDDLADFNAPSVARRLRGAESELIKLTRK